MQTGRILALCLLCLLLISCSTEDDDVADDDTGDDDVADDDSAGDDDDAEPPCDGESWGQISDPQNAVHVRADGSDDTGDGSPSAPFANLQAALEASRELDAPKNIAVGPGTFVTNIQVRHDAGDEMTDDGLVIEGCGPDETILEGGGGEAAVDSVILVAGALDVRLAGFGTMGGRRAIWVWSGSATSIHQVDVRNSVRLGIIIGGWDSFASLDTVNVIDTVVETDNYGVEYGYGISIQDATAEFNDVHISGSTKVGMLVDMGILTSTGITVDGTAPDSNGFLGRGIQAQNWAYADFIGGDIGLAAANNDAGIFAQAAHALYVNDMFIEGTTTGNLLDETCADFDCPGEGIVVTQGSLGEDPANYPAEMNGNTITNCSRAGILVDGVAVDLNDNVADGSNLYNVDGNSIYLQGDYVMTGNQSPSPVEQAMRSPLYLELVEIDDLID